MENTIEILKYLGPFIGVFIGWLLGRKNESDKIKYSEKRQVKRTLFVLLEIRNELVQSKIVDRYLNVYLEKIKAKIGDENIDNFLSENLKSIIGKILESTNENNFNIKEQFDKCVNNLSEIAPLLAYKINGKQNVRKFIDSWENESRTLLAFEDINEVNQAIDHFKPKFIKEIQTDFESIIIYVAELIGKKETKLVKNIISEPEDIEVEKVAEKSIKKMFDGIL